MSDRLKKIKEEFEANLMHGTEVFLEVMEKENRPLTGAEIHLLMRERAASLAQVFGPRMLDEGWHFTSSVKVDK